MSGRAITKLERKDIREIGAPFVNLINPPDDVSFPTLDLSGKKFRLRNLENINLIASECSALDKGAARRKIIEINVSNNQLQSLAQLCEYGNELMFVNAKQIVAENNWIQYMCMSPANPQLRRWPRRMDALRVLKLGSNRLDEFPDCQHMRHLEVLHLNNNNIKSANQTVKRGLEDIAKYCPHLRELRLDSNSISWTPKEFAEEHASFSSKRLKSLRVLTLSNNPFTLNIRLYEIYVLRFATRVRKFNGRVVTDALRSRAKNIRPFDAHLIEGSAGAISASKDSDASTSKIGYEESELSVDAEDVQSLSQLQELLESCFSDPLNAMKMVHKFLRSSKIVASTQRNMDLLFDVSAVGSQSGRSKDASVERIVDVSVQHESERAAVMKIQSMLQNVKVLMERQPNLTPALTKSLGYLACVYSDRCKQFGKLCLEQLLNIYEGMKSAVATRTAIESVLSTVLVKNLGELYSGRDSGSDDKNDIKRSLMEGLTEMVLKAPELSKSLGHMARNAGQWITQSTSGPELHQLEFLAAMTLDVDNVKELTHSSVAVHINVVMRRLVKDVGYNKKTISLLKIARNICRSNVKAALEVCTQKPGMPRALHVVLCDEIKKLKPAPGDSWHIEKIRVCAQILNCLEAMTRLDDVDSQIVDGIFERKILATVGKYVIRQQPPMHPMIIAAALNLFTALLSRLRRRAIKSRLPRWDDLQRVISREYLEDPTVVLKMINADDPLFARVVAQVEAHNGTGVKTDDGALVSLVHLTNKDMTDMIIAAIRLVEHYSIAGIDNVDSREISVKLNRANREHILLANLAVPNYDVRLAVTRCLTNVDSSQLNDEEIKLLLSHLKGTENISAGATEMVLAKIFDIFSKLVLSTKEESPTRMLAFQEMTNCAWDVLARNMHRNVEVTNVQEKQDQGVLSRACVSFLIALSSGGSAVDLESVARKMIRMENLDRWTDILHREDRSCGVTGNIETVVRAVSIETGADGSSNHGRGEQSHSATMFHAAKYFPVAIERCYVGRKVRYLIAALRGRDGQKKSTGGHQWNLNPTGVVACRVVSRLADILEGIADPLQSQLLRTMKSAQIGQSTLKRKNFDGDGGGATKTAAGMGESEYVVNEGPFTFFCDRRKRVPELLAFQYFVAALYDSNGGDVGDSSYSIDKSRITQWVASMHQREAELAQCFLPEMVLELPTARMADRENARDSNDEASQDRDVRSMLRQMHEQQRMFVQGGGVETLVSFIASGAPVDLSDGSAFGRGSELPEELNVVLSRQGRHFDDFEENGDERSSVDEKGNGGSESSVGIDEMHRRYMSTDLDGANTGVSLKEIRASTTSSAARVTRSTLNRAHIVAAGLRALCATLRFCSDQDRPFVLRQLRQIELLHLITAVVRGDPSRPSTAMWFLCGVGLKLVLLFDAILRADLNEILVGSSDAEAEDGDEKLSRSEVAARRQLRLMDIAAKTARGALGAVAAELSSGRALTKRHNQLVFGAARLCHSVCRMLPLIPSIRSAPATARVGATEWLFRRLFGMETLHHIVKFLLRDLAAAERQVRRGMTGDGSGRRGEKRSRQNRRRSTEARTTSKTSRTSPNDGRVKILKFDLLVLQERRAKLVDVVVEFLVHMRKKRFNILEMFVSSGHTDGEVTVPTAFMQEILDTLSRHKYRDAFEQYLLSQMGSRLSDLTSKAREGDDGRLMLSENESVLLTRWVRVWSYMTKAYAATTSNTKTLVGESRLLVLTQHRILMYKMPSTSFMSALWKRDEGGQSWPVSDPSIFRLGLRGCDLRDVRRVITFHGSSRLALILQDPVAENRSSVLAVQMQLSARDEAHSLKALIVQLAHVACRRSFLPKEFYPNNSVSDSGEDVLSRVALGTFLKDSPEFTRRHTAFQYMRVKVLDHKADDADRILVIVCDPMSDESSSRRGQSDCGSLLLLREDLSKWWFTLNNDSAIESMFLKRMISFFSTGNSKLGDGVVRPISGIQYISLQQSAEASMVLVFEGASPEKSDTLSLLFASTEARQCAFLSIVACHRRFR